eukprot:333801-Chlamydomonas_euryale.AAC.2
MWPTLETGGSRREQLSGSLQAASRQKLKDSLRAAQRRPGDSCRTADGAGCSTGKGACIPRVACTHSMTR